MHLIFGGRQLMALGVAAIIGVAACSNSATPPTVASSAPPASSAAPSSAPPASPSSAGSAAPSSAGSATAANAVQIKGFAFNPATITVKAGTTVTWTNADNVHHTVTDDKGGFDSGPISNGTTFSQTFKTAGTFTYHCKIHPSMTATVVVQ